MSLKLKLKSAFILLIAFLLFIIISCTGSQNTSLASTTLNESSIIEYTELYKWYASEFDIKNHELSQEFEKLNDINEQIDNINKNIENIKKYKSNLNSLKIPKELEKFHLLKIKEIDHGIRLLELTIEHYRNGTPDIQELQMEQQKLYEYNEDSYNNILDVLKSKNLEYLMN